MKKTLFTLFVFLTVTCLFAQIPRQKVLVELTTGVECPPCHSAANGIDDLYENGDPVVAIAYHSYMINDPFATPEALARDYYYDGWVEVPDAHFDGSYDHKPNGWSEGSEYDNYLPIVNARMEIPTSFEVDIFGTNDGDEYSISVRLKKIGEYPNNEDLVLHLALTESNIPYNWQGLTEVNHCERVMVPHVDGTPISFTNIENEVDVELTFFFNNTWVDENCELIAWIQDNDNKEVLHCNSVMLLDLETPPTFLANFYSNRRDLCVPDSVYFYEDCPGEPGAYNWKFEGGSPDTTSEPNPSVYYNEMGKYDVSLTVSDGTIDYTMIRADHITDTGAPAVLFREVPPLCNEDWDPYLFTEGYPEGGEYYGPFITEGKYFHPTEAGIGNYIVVYIYTDEWGCENSEWRDVTVVDCVGLEENAQDILATLHPNPTDGEFSLTLKTLQDEIVDVLVLNELGAVVYSQEQISIRNARTLNINLKEHAAGIYSLVVRSDKGMINKKIVVK